MITEEHLREVCALGQGEATCSYLMHGPDGWECAKIMPGYKAHIDRRRAENSMRAKGDNCPGWQAEHEGEG